MPWIDKYPVSPIVLDADSAPIKDIANSFLIFMIICKLLVPLQHPGENNVAQHEQNQKHLLATGPSGGIFVSLSFTTFAFLFRTLLGGTHGGSCAESASTLLRCLTPSVSESLLEASLLADSSAAASKISPISPL